MTTLNLQVGASTDDCYRRLVSSEWALDSVYMNIGDSNVGTYDRRGGTRFTGVTIGQGDTIDAATGQLRAKGLSGSIPVIYIEAEDVDDAATFTTSGNYDGRARTSAVSWTPGAWVAGTWYTTSELKTIIQVPVDRGGWAGDGLVIFWRDVEGYGGSQFAWADSWDAGSAFAPKLDIDYTAGGPAIVEGAAVITGTGALAAAAYAIASGASVLSGAGTLSASPLGIAFGASALSGLGALEGVGVRVVPGVAALSGTGSLTADAFLIVDAQAAIPGIGTLSADGLTITFAAAALSGAGALSGTGTRVVLSVAALSGIGALAATGQVIPGGIIVDGAAALSGAGALSASAYAITFGASTLSGTGDLTGDGLGIAMASAPLTGIGGLSGTALLIVPAAALLTGLGTLEGTGQVVGYFVTAPGQTTIGSEVVTALEVSDQLAVTSSLMAEGKLAASRLKISDAEVTKLTISDEP